MDSKEQDDVSESLGPKESAISNNEDIEIPVLDDDILIDFEKLQNEGSFTEISLKDLLGGSSALEYAFRSGESSSTLCVSSEDLLQLKPEEMCENWDDLEDKRRRVYWGSRGLIQERYVKTLFKELDTPDEARPTLARVASEEFPSGRVPFSNVHVTTNRLPSGISNQRRQFRIKPHPMAQDQKIKEE